MVQIPEQQSLLASQCSPTFAQPPSNTEQHSIHSLISDYKDDLASVASEISRVEEILDELHSRRANLVSSIHSCQVAIAPHRKLPNEILAKVFMESAPNPVSLFLSFDNIWRSTP
jgi:hypothetical protein